MKLSLFGIGRMKRGAEREMVDDYLKRAAKLARPLGFREVKEVELEAGPDQKGEAEKLLSKIPDGAHLILFDERGEELTSKAFAKRLETLRDQGCPQLCLAIGGADGFSDELKAQADDKICLGRFTWPHKLVRVMAAEQIYRALSLLAGTPYHRE